VPAQVQDQSQRQQEHSPWATAPQPPTEDRSHPQAHLAAPVVRTCQTGTGRRASGGSVRGSRSVEVVEVVVVAVVVGWGLLWGRVVLLLERRLARRPLRTWLVEGDLAGGRRVAFPQPAPVVHSVSDATAKWYAG
jgi:hypothetical protein